MKKLNATDSKTVKAWLDKVQNVKLHYSYKPKNS